MACFHGTEYLERNKIPQQPGDIIFQKNWPAVSIIWLQLPKLDVRGFKIEKNSNYNMWYSLMLKTYGEHDTFYIKENVIFLL